MRTLTVLPIAVAIGLASMLGPGSGQAQLLEPKLPDLSGIVRDQNWAIVLGKALFWDVAVGSDGMACASCHFHAGADARIANALSPGLLELPELDADFGATAAVDPFGLGETASGGIIDSAYELVEGDFPFQQLADITDRNSQLLVTTNDVASSAGAVGATLTRIRPVGPFDDCDAPLSDVFHAGGLAARQVEPRNTPTVINAVFNHRNFWDGRAMNSFSGVGVFGAADVDNDPAARLVVHDDGAVELTSLELPDASLASQAVGPPLSNLEMSCGERNFPSVGRKLLGAARKPLSLQLIHADDSVFGASGPFGDLRASNGRGLRSDHTYRKLIERAFEDRWWAAPDRYRITADGQLVQGGPGSFSQAELNFSMFWGIAVMLYEATLISDDSPFDRGELSDAAEHGRALFTTGSGAGGGGCSGCHTLPLGTQAAQFADSAPFVTIQTVNRPNGLLDGSGNPITTDALRDRGFFPLGVRPVAEDIGLGGTDPYGGPLSFARKSILDGSNPGGVTRTIVDGSFKVPGLRNVALTPPYFHNGGFADLHQVLEFYRRAGDRRDASLAEAGATGDDSGTGVEGEGLIPMPGPDKGSNAAGTLNPLRITDQDADDIVAFLEALTDRRVQCDEAPFDHPELRIPVGQQPSDANGDGRADDIYFRLPEVGAAGYDPASGFCIPNAGDLFAPGMQARIGGPSAPPLE
jgi:cytochrome c peroxidase